MKYANADVRKQFFTEMFTRDISLEDCVLDLIDNSIDSFLLKKAIPVSQLIFGPQPSPAKWSPGKIEVSCNERQIKVVDRCGGIPRKRAEHEIFCFGHDPSDTPGKLGAYGVGMKRALFKIGNKFEITSRTAAEGFQASLTIDKWIDDPKWKIPLEYVPGSGSESSAGTAITITDLHDEVALRIREGGVPKTIHSDAASTYPFFLKTCIDLSINTVPVDPQPIRLGEATGVLRAAREEFTFGGVNVKLVASVAAGERKDELAGWYILCNGRAVVRANKDNLTGWGTDMASYQPKYRGFVGIASFESDDPLSLPWTTTKRNINRESAVFLRTRNLMTSMSKPVLTFLSAQYPTEVTTETDEIRNAVGDVRQVSFSEIALRPSAGFSYTPPKKRTKTMDWVRYQALISKLDKVRRHLRRPTMGSSEIGKYALEHFIKTECGSD
jgi:hypothetical protein